MSLSRIIEFAPIVQLLNEGGSWTTHPDLKCLRVDVALGRNSGSAVIVYRKNLQETHQFGNKGIVQSIELTDLFTKTLGQDFNPIARVLVEYPAGILRTVHLGQITDCNFQLDVHGEKITLTSNVPDHFYGTKLHKFRVVKRDATVAATNTSLETWEEGTPRDTWSPEGLEFNPVDDLGRSLPNLFKLKEYDVPGGLKILDPRSVTEKDLLADYEAIVEAEPGVAPATKFADCWTIPTAVSFVCWTLNPYEDYVLNPTIEEIESQLGAASTDRFSLLRGVTIPVGASLPEALNRILEQYDYTWYADPSNGEKLKIKLVNTRSQGFGIESKALKLQRYNDTLDVEQTRVAELDLSVQSETRSASRVIGMAGRQQIEVSAELRPAWKEEFDAEYASETSERLQKSSPEWIKNPDLQVAWRKFAANEGGDYTDLRGHFFFAQQWFYLDCNGANQETLVRRRSMKPCLTKSENGRPAGPVNGYVLEYWDPDKGETGGWVLAVGGHSGSSAIFAAQDVQILKDEIAVLFNGDVIPPKLTGIYEAHGIANLKLRLTGTIEVDDPMHYQRDNLGLTGGWKVAVLDLKDRFSVKSQYLDSYYRETIEEDEEAEIYTDTRDDCEPFKQYVTMIAQQNGGASISGSAVLEGADNPEWIEHLGKPVNKVEGRDIGLSRDPAGPLPSYPSIVKVRFNFLRQTTTLSLEVM